MKKSTKNMLVAFLLNLLFSAIEFAGGLYTHSISIVSDSLHDLGDSISIGTALFLEKKSEQAPNEKYTYGYLRFSILGALLTTVILVVGSILVVVGTVERFIHPTPVNYDGMLVMAVVGVIINGLAAFKTSKGKGVNERALSLHMLEDVLGWLAILVGSLVIKFTDWHIIDPLLSLAIAIFVLFHAFSHLKEVLDIFLEKAPDELEVDKIKAELAEIPAVADVHHVHLWTIDGHRNYATLHAMLETATTPEEFERIKGEIRHRLLHLGIDHSTIEFEYVKCDSDHCHLKPSENHGHSHGHSHSHSHEHHHCEEDR